MSAPRCRQCGKTFRDGEPGWAEDWKVLQDDGSFRMETRYTCDDCEAGA